MISDVTPSSLSRSNAPWLAINNSPKMYSDGTLCNAWLLMIVSSLLLWSVASILRSFSLTAAIPYLATKADSSFI